MPQPPRTRALAALLFYSLCVAPAYAGPPLPSGLPANPSGRPHLLVLVVALDPGAQAQLGQLEQAAEQAVLRSGRFELVRLTDVLDPASARQRAAKFAEGEAELLAGQKAYEELDTQKSAARFAEAVKAFKQTDLTRHLGELSRAWTMKIASMIANQDTRAAQNELEKLLAVDPRAQFSTNYFGPDALKQAEDSRRSALNGKAELNLRTTPRGARVFLDGQYRGLSPLTLNGLAGGEHFVSVLSPGYSLFQEPHSAGTHEVVLRASEQAGVYRSAVELIAAGPNSAGRDLAAKRLGAGVGADQVLLALARKGAGKDKLDLVLERLEVKDAHNAGFAEATVPTGEPLAAAVDAALSSPLSKDEPRRGGPLSHYAGAAPAPASDSSSALLGKRPLGYGLLIGGVALVGVGLVFGLQATTAHAQYRDTPQTDLETSSTFQTRGQRFALMADLFTLGGLVAAGAGGYFAFLAPTEPAEPTGHIDPVLESRWLPTSGRPFLPAASLHR